MGLGPFFWGKKQMWRCEQACAWGAVVPRGVLTASRFGEVSQGVSALRCWCQVMGPSPFRGARQPCRGEEVAGKTLLQSLREIAYSNIPPRSCFVILRPIFPQFCQVLERGSHNLSKASRKANQPRGAFHVCYFVDALGSRLVFNSLACVKGRLALQKPACAWGEEKQASDRGVLCPSLGARRVSFFF